MSTTVKTGQVDTTQIATLTGTQTLTNKTITSPVIRDYDGWIDANETWTYASPSTFTVSGDVTAKYHKGTYLKYTQTTVKSGVVVSSSYGAPNTTVTIAVNTDYTIANAAISANYYSYQENPQGFPDYFNFTPTWSGFSANPSTGFAKYSIHGKNICLKYEASSYGTSNATTKSMTGCPVNLVTTHARIPVVVRNNGVDSLGLMQTNAGSGQLNFTTDVGTTGWTASGQAVIYGFSLVFEYN